MMYAEITKIYMLMNPAYKSKFECRLSSYVNTIVYSSDIGRYIAADMK
jgi:hypothetical protein